MSKKPKSAHEGLELVSRLQCEAAGGEWTDTWHEVPEAIRVAAIARGQTTGPLGGRRNGGFRGCVGLPTRDQFMRCVGDWECEGTCQEWTGLCSERIDPMPYGGCRPHCIDGQVKNMCTN